MLSYRGEEIIRSRYTVPFYIKILKKPLCIEAINPEKLSASLGTFLVNRKSLKNT